MFGGINPGQMKAMMKQMGIKQEDIAAERVIIERADGRTVIEPAQVQKIIMQGQESWQVSGQAKEESKEVAFSDEDVSLVMDKTGKSRKDVESVLRKTKDIADAIVQLSE